jgi:excisionase family DNA binding protein
LVVNVIDGVEMVDVRRAAQLVRRTPETVRRWIWSGRLPAVRRGNRLLVARQALDDLTSSRATTAGPELSLRAWAALAAVRVPRC